MAKHYSVNKRPKHLVLYPLYVEGYNNLNGNMLKNCLSIDNVLNNILVKNYKNLKIEVNYSLVADKLDNNYIYGRFIKLKKDNIEKLMQDTQSNIEKIKEELLTLKDNEFIEENAYFVFNLKSGIMLANYNPDSVNILKSAASDTFNNAMQKCKYNDPIKLYPFPSDELIDDMINNGSQILKYHIIFPQLSLQRIEDIDKHGVFNDIFSLADSNQSFGLMFEMSLSKPQTLTHKVLNLLKEYIKKFGKIEKFTVYTDYMNFDLIADRYVYFSIDIEVKDDLEDNMKNIYKNIYDLLVEKQDRILNMVKKDLLPSTKQDKLM